MLKHLRRASALRFPRRRTLNPRTLPQTLKPYNLGFENFEPKLENTSYTQYSLQSLLSYIREHDILNVNVWATHGVCG